MNLGFSGSARGERAVADYIASMDISAFVLDYDRNLPTAAELREKHFEFYKAVRDAHRDIPIIIMSYGMYPVRNTPEKFHDRESFDCRAVILDTYTKALKDGDKNIYFVDGETIFASGDEDACTVDGCHPNDLGFYCMAKRVYPVLKSGLEKTGVRF